jgi:hypothetical protein
MLWVPSLHHKHHVTLFIFTKRTKRQKLYFHSLGYFNVHFSSDFVTFFLCILHKFACSQIIQDGLELQILGTICYLFCISIWLLDFRDLSVTFHLPLPLFVNMTELLTTVIQVGGLTRRKTWFNPPFSWKIPVLSRE